MQESIGVFTHESFTYYRIDLAYFGNAYRQSGGHANDGNKRQRSKS